MTKPFSVTFQLDARILALLYICYMYKFPTSYMLSFYEMFGAQSLFILKAFSCTKKMPLPDNVFIKIIEESRLLHKQILSGISINMERNRLQNILKHGGRIKDEIPEEPALDLSQFTMEEYKDFIEDYLLDNIENIYSMTPTLYLDSTDLYSEIR